MREHVRCHTGRERVAWLAECTRAVICADLEGAGPPAGHFARRAIPDRALCNCWAVAWGVAAPHLPGEDCRRERDEGGARERAGRARCLRGREPLAVHVRSERDHPKRRLALGGPADERERILTARRLQVDEQESADVLGARRVKL